MRKSYYLSPWKKMVLISSALLMTAGCGRRTEVAFEEPVTKTVKVEADYQALRMWAGDKAKADLLVRIDSSDGIAFFPDNLRESIKNTADHLRRRNISVLDRIAPFIQNGGSVNIAYETGLFKRLVWVLPSKQPIASLPIEEFRRVLVETRGYRETELMDLEIKGNNIEGMIAGIPVTVTTLEDLDVAEQTAIVDLNLNFFLGIKAQDPDFRIGTKTTIDLLRKLKEKRIKTRYFTISLSAFSGRIPMDMRFIGRLIEEFLANPGYLDGELPEKYRMMIAAEDSLVDKKYAEAAAIYQKLSERYDDDPGIFFSLAVARGFEGKGEESRDALVNAYLLDPAYVRGFFQLARILAANDEIKTGEIILKAPELETVLSREELDFQKGIFYMAGRRYYSAITYLELVAQKRPSDFALRTTLYNAYTEVGNDLKREITLEKLIDLDSERVERDMPWVYKELGILMEKKGKVRRAAELYRTYLELVPGDKDAAELRGKIESWK